MTSAVPGRQIPADTTLLDLARANNQPALQQWLASQAEPLAGARELLVAARQAMTGGLRDEARVLLRAILAGSKEPSLVQPVASLLGDLALAAGDWLEARGCFQQLPVNNQTWPRLLATYTESLDLPGLAELAEIIGGQGPSPALLASLVAAGDRIVARLAAQEEIAAGHRQRYEENAALLARIAPGFFERLAPWGFPDQVFSSAIALPEGLFLRTAGGWQRLALAELAGKYRPDQLLSEFTEGVLVRCLTLEHLARFLAGVATDAPSFLKATCFLAVPPGVLQLGLALLDLGTLARCDFIFRLLDPDRFEADLAAVIRQENLILPTRSVGFQPDDATFVQENVTPLLERLRDEIKVEVANGMTRLAHLYPPDFGASLPEKIGRGGLRVMSFTSRFSTFVQHCTASFMRALGDQDCQTRVVIEGPYDPPGFRLDHRLRYIADFQPDLLLLVDHLKQESGLPATIPCVSWIQDKLEPVTSGRHVQKIGHNDLLLVQTYLEDLHHLGYPNLVRFPVPADEQIFDTAPATDRCERAIAYVNHCPNPAASLLPEPAANHALNERIHALLAPAFTDSRSMPITLADYQAVLRPILDDSQTTSGFYEEIRATIGNYLLRTEVLGWLVQSGRDLDIYGKGWERQPLLAPYARGPVQPGPDLVQVYNRTAVNLHMHPFTTTHQRVFEAILAGSLVLVYRLDDDRDLNPLEQYLAEGEGYLFFRNREDLSHKIGEILDAPQRRLAIIERGRAKVRERFTYAVAARQLLALVAHHFGAPSPAPENAP
ncbi:MAG: glycosyltransferase [Thermodesulfobacteriota bacterium]